MKWHEFSLGAVLAPTNEIAQEFASKHGLWDKRPDGTWSNDASMAHAQLSADMQAAYRTLASLSQARV